MIKKIAKMCDYYESCNGDSKCPLSMAGWRCMAMHSPMYLATESNELDEVERIVTEWEQPVDWEAISERAKTEDVKVLVWDDDPDNKFPRYLASYNAHGNEYDGSKFETFSNGATRWSVQAYIGTSWWKHAELVEEDDHE